jgi:hypothetical protein
MQLNEHIIRGKKGKTVCYKLENLRFGPNDNKLKWDAFRFYTPEGEQTDEEGFTYFDVPDDEFLILRDELLNKEFVILVSKDEGVEFVEVIEDADMESFSIGLEGDIVASGFIPTNPDEEIVIDYKEVSYG